MSSLEPKGGIEMKRSKRYMKLREMVDKHKLYEPEEAIELVKKLATAKFDETIEVAIKLGVDPRRSDQNVRGTVVLPHGTGKVPKILAFAKGDKAQEAKEAGADIVGAEDLVEEIKKGFSDFDVIVATPDMMPLIGRNLGRILGPRMPSPKAGTVGPNIGQIISELKKGKVQFRIDRYGIIHVPIGKASFSDQALLENLYTLLRAVLRAKPPAAKGQYLQSITLSPTMGPGVRVNPVSLQKKIAQMVF